MESFFSCLSSPSAVKAFSSKKNRILSPLSRKYLFVFVCVQTPTTARHDTTHDTYNTHIECWRRRGWLEGEVVEV
jgi:hypothetical protein